MQRQSKEERQRQRALEEARKAGIVAPETDEEGKPINPHIPQFMASAPWYLNQDQPTLKHQKNWKGTGTGPPGASKQAWYARGSELKGFQATKYRKGACTNCGSMSHKAKDCLERPRAKGARYTNKNIAADEKEQRVHVEDFDAKRDRWNGFDEREWAKNAEKFEAVAALREEMRKKEALEKALDGEAGGNTDAAGIRDGQEKNADAHSDGEEYVELEDGAGAEGKIRQLRIREDTAKYLLNLDVNSAYYDPKSRSMREDPNPNKPAHEKTFHGDNFVRGTGAEGFTSLNLYSVTSAEAGKNLHMLAMPSAAELSFKAVQERKKMLQQANTKSVLDRYGNAADEPSADLKAVAQTEQYAEYDARGRVVRGQDVKVVSRYEEDVLIGNHTAIWGSWYDIPSGTWGYACCHGTTKGSYCTGEDGKVAAAKNREMLASNMERVQAADAVPDQEGAKGDGNAGLSKDVWGSDVLKKDLDQDKLKEAIAAIKKSKQEKKPEEVQDERKRGYNSMQGAGVNMTEEEMEAYRMLRTRADDPLMAMKKTKK